MRKVNRLVGRLIRKAGIAIRKHAREVVLIALGHALGSLLIWCFIGSSPIA